MDREHWIDLASAACDDAGIDHGPIEIIMTWDQKFSDYDAYRNSAVFRIGGQRCLKLYGPTSERRFHVERSVLRTLLDRTSAIPAPCFIAAKAHSHLPPYLIMSEIAGSTVQDSWETLTRGAVGYRAGDRHHHRGHPLSAPGRPGGSGAAVRWQA